MFVQQFNCWTNKDRKYRLHDGAIKIQVDGEANQALIEFLADELGMPKSRLEVVAGAKGRDKLVSVLDMDAETLHRKIIENISVDWGKIIFDRISQTLRVIREQVIHK